MKPKILFVRPAGSPETAAFIDVLSKALSDWDMKVSDAGLSTALFEIKKYDVANFFTSASSKGAFRFARKGSNTKIVQILTSAPESPEEYKDSIFGDRIVSFCETDKAAVLQQRPGVSVDCIPPCSPEIPVSAMSSPAEIRRKYDVGERLLVVSLTDFSDHSHFSAFLYTAREYQRRDGFRFLLPLYRRDKESLRWRDSLKKIVEQEKLTLTSFIEDSSELHSLIDAADFCLHITKERRSSFDFPLNVAEALCAGKPVVCFNIPPVNEWIASFRKEWIANTNEDYSRISKDLSKQSPQLEQISTELARFSRSHLSVESVANRYRELYKSLLSL